MTSPFLKLVAMAAGLGALAGMRGIAGPALVSNALSRRPELALRHRPLRLLASSTVANILKALAATEIVADKVPGMPDRTKPPLLAWRALTGAFAGAALFQYRERNVLLGGVIGGLAAVAAAYAVVNARKRLAARAHVPQQVVGLVEDGLVMGAGTRLARNAFDSHATE